MDERLGQATLDDSCCQHHHNSCAQYQISVQQSIYKSKIVINQVKKMSVLRTPTTTKLQSLAHLLLLSFGKIYASAKETAPRMPANAMICILAADIG